MNRTTAIIFGIFMAVVSIGLFVLCFFLAVQGGIRTFSDPKVITLFSIPASFGIFFTVISLNLLIVRKREPKEELFSLNSWRVLAILMLTVAGVVLVLGNWLGAIIPVVIAAICLIKDPKVREFYQAWF